ncbi:unnamed protein product [Linum tenue]|uniref:Protein DA1-like domain-containing protein n=1 Tax=Linum tenue TaxID=586396 RepID=A0AAV0LMQ0_9ROSI|nr:unnamed protein product [Linum tenue]
MPETRGLCLSEEQTISQVRKRFGGGQRPMDMITEPYKLIRRCDVTAILILYGLPSGDADGLILSMLQGYQPLSQDVEEGICQVMAHMWLDTQLNFESSSSSTGSRADSRAPFDKKLGSFFKHQIESDSSPVYGDGFRAGQLAVRKYGLQRTLEHIQMTGRFPF